MNNYWSGMLTVITVGLVALAIYGFTTPLRDGHPWHIITVALAVLGAAGCVAAAASLYIHGDDR